MIPSRSSGVLLHPTSLPGGRLGPAAYRFVDWLLEAGQKWWQVLPLHPPDSHGSPYKASSAFAGWPGLLADPAAPVTAAEAERFAGRHAAWIDAWTSFAGHGALADEVRFEREWGALRRYANERGVWILGDLPVYVAGGSADHVAHPELFRDDVVAGVPPDFFSAEGQLWSNPVYHWPAHRASGFRWWIDRLRRALELADAVRIDHFRGLVAYWAVPRGARTARAGAWRRAPGRELLRTAGATLGRLPVVAEDLGVITPAVEQLRDELGLPGMVVLQYALSGRPATLLARMPEARVVYPGTHDNDTALGWWEHAPAKARRDLERALVAAGIAEESPSWALVRLALASPARLAILPLQDLLELGSEARMNTPGTDSGNWSWRLERLPGPELARRLRALTEAAGRA